MGGASLTVAFVLGMSCAVGNGVEVKDSVSPTLELDETVEGVIGVSIALLGGGEMTVEASKAKASGA